MWYWVAVLSLFACVASIQVWQMGLREVALGMMLGGHFLAFFCAMKSPLESFDALRLRVAGGLIMMAMPFAYGATDGEWLKNTLATLGVVGLWMLLRSARIRSE